MRKRLLLSTAAILFTSSLLTTKANATWIKDSKGWWNSEGISYSIGWRYIDSQWYLFNNEGYMVTGWNLSDGKWYYFYSNGAMAKDTNIDNYYLGNDGAWIKPYSNKNSAINDDSLRKNIYNNLSDDIKKKIKDYKSSNVYKIYLREDMGVILDKSFIGKEVYIADFETITYRIPNNIIVYASIDDFKIIGYGYVE